ncbi:porin [Flavihumibacter sp. R14]|nr:porin [Flavihumibacter soli]
MKIRYLPWGCILGCLMLILPDRGFGQDTIKVIPDGTEGETLPLIDSTTKKKPFNSFNLGFTSFKIGVAFLYEYAGFSQDDEGKRQMDSANVSLDPGFDVRDTRLFFSGKLKTKRTVTWKAGVMYDGSLNSWFLRESGIMIAVPELWGHIFVGRTKEGVSLSKVMSGYAVEMLERHMASDPIPILADGVKWMGFLPKQRIFWNLGIYADWLSKGQSFSTDSWQFASRLGWLPVYSEATKTHLHIAANIRLGHPVNDTIRIKSRPEANPAPFFMDSGKFRSDQSTYLGWEIYYSSGPWMLGTEYFWHKFSSPEKGDPVFNGGEVVVTYLFGGESRPYTTAGGNIYGFVPVKKSVFKGGPGTWEAGLRYSIFNMNDGLVQAGKFWRVTPTVNWYLADFLRFELSYGYGVLDRFNLKGATHFLQSRIAFTIR